MKGRIENEVVKAGRTGAQREARARAASAKSSSSRRRSNCFTRAGSRSCKARKPCPCLDKLVQYELLSAEESRLLAEAYCFLREVEHRLQMEDNLQTHTIPADRPAQERLARLMGFATLEGVRSRAPGPHRQRAPHLRPAAQGRCARRRSPVAVPAPVRGRRGGVEEACWPSMPSRTWTRRSACCGSLSKGRATCMSRRAPVELAHQLLPKLFALCPQAGTRSTASRNRQPKWDAAERVRSHEAAPLSDPDRVVTRLDSFISAYGARATLFELWNSNPAIFELLVLLFDRSEFLAELAIRTPDLVDELVTSGRLRQRKSAEETLRDLRHGLDDEDQHLWLRRYHQAELMRIGLRDILGLADFEQYLTELSGLADACLQYALEVVMRKHKLKTPPFVIIGLGKLGGAEIDYGSDLDVLFVADSKAKNLPALAPPGARSAGPALGADRARRGLPHRRPAAAGRREGPAGQHAQRLRGVLSAARAALGDSIAHAHPAGRGRPETGRSVPNPGRAR